MKNRTRSKRHLASSLPVEIWFEDHQSAVGIKLSR